MVCFLIHFSRNFLTYFQLYSLKKDQQMTSKPIYVLWSHQVSQEVFFELSIPSLDKSNSVPIVRKTNYYNFFNFVKRSICYLLLPLSVSINMKNIHLVSIELFMESFSLSCRLIQWLNWNFRFECQYKNVCRIINIGL